jgi:hypothetical protein
MQVLFRLARPTECPVNAVGSLDLGDFLMEWECFEDRKNRGDGRVEAIDFDNEGEVYVTIFSGPHARERAQEYAAMKIGFAE